ncbi:hypothetical protein NS115_18160 [Paenibacillus jamilae]|uniref:Uncharacterized protein n=1 Tax=Paenibacillus jamilae TaxID=114136 RepID=A0ACC4ZSQ2_9BACL|nr:MULTISPECIES: lanthionine synthetase C family protein [Paenibacillus]AUO09476.1 hypothetical protein C0638_24545 [Paenibacillus sp. lzh-N1]KTS80882.1 hypothetical protein NS115_18160 [Paenibacillus jamilae]MBU9708188.1 lanthionine synthetase C family protein [Paenibacillus sp. AK121]
MKAASAVSTQWIPLSGEVRKQVAQVLQAIVQRYKDPDQVRAQMKQVPGQVIEGKQVARWSDTSFSGGFTGICVLMGQLDQLYPDNGWDMVGHSYLQKIQQVIEQQGIHTLSLYSGLAGILLGVRALSRKNTRYQGMLDTLASWFEEAVLNYVEICKNQWEEGQLRISQYDTIEGLTGIARVVLAFSDRPQMKIIWQRIVEVFHIFCGEKDYQGHRIPAWHILSANQFLEHEKVQYPNGNFNLGLSHGISGPLAFLSLSQLQGMTTEAMRADLRRLTEWICRWRVSGEAGTLWPGRVAVEEVLQGELHPSSIRDPWDSWCYGVPGIARSIWLAGQAMHNQEWSAIGLQAYVDIENRIQTMGGLTASTLCHGIGGLLHMVQRMYSDTGHVKLGAIRDELVVAVLDKYAAESKFGYYDEYFVNGKYEQVDEAGFLTGAAGVALVLASLLCEESPDWDQALLIR